MQTQLFDPERQYIVSSRSQRTLANLFTSINHRYSSCQLKLYLSLNAVGYLLNIPFECLPGKETDTLNIGNFPILVRVLRFFFLFIKLVILKTCHFDISLFRKCLFTYLPYYYSLLLKKS